MNDKVGKLVERVRLTGDEIFKIEQDFHKALRESGCFLEPHTVYRPGIKVYLEAQLNKVLNDDDLALIDSDQTAPCTQLEENRPPHKGLITQDYLNGRLSVGNAGFRKVVPLAEAMKEVNNG